MTTRKEFKDQPIELLVLNADRTALDKVSFRADLDARLDKGMPQYAIPDSWVASVKHGSRTHIVHLTDGVWFAAEVLPSSEDDDA